MKRISLWASCHPVAARSLMGVIHTILFFLMMELAGTLSGMGILVPAWVAGVLLLLLTIDFGIYYSGRRRWKRMLNGRYGVRKLNEAFVAAACAFLVMAAFNHQLLPRYYPAVLLGSSHSTGLPVPAAPPMNPSAALPTAPPVGSKSLDQLAGSVLTPLPATRVKLGSIKKQLRQEMKQARKNNRGLKVFGIIFLGVVLVLALAVLSCMIACNGAEAIGLLLFLGGTGLIAFGITRWVQKVNRSGPYRDKEPEAPAAPAAAEPLTR